MKQHLDNILEKARKWKSRLNHSIEGDTYKNSEDIKTSLTLTYRENAWNIDRIVLDTVSNHLPADSKGTSVGVDFKQEDQWIDFRNYNPDIPVQSIRVNDDGVGFDYNMLGVLFSTKTQDVMSVGQFGEGIKMVSAACLRSSMPIQFSSRNWKATPYVKYETIDKHSIDRLCFKVDCDEKPMAGSMTLFENPQLLLIDEFVSLPQNMLAFNKEYEILFSSKSRYGEKILDMKKAPIGIFVKGVRMKRGLGVGSDTAYFKVGNDAQLFSYDLMLDSLSPDRQIADRNAALSRISSLLTRCTNEEVISNILKMSKYEPHQGFLEYEALSYQIKNRQRNSDRGLFSMGGMGTDNFYLSSFRNPFAEFGVNDYKINKLLKGYARDIKSSPNLWRDKFYEIFGEKSVLSSHDLEHNKDAESIGYNVVKVHSDMETYLRDIGVKTASELFKKENRYLWVDDSDLTESERAMLKLIPKINNVILGSDREVNVRVYKGKYAVTELASDSNESTHSKLGAEVSSDLGFYTNKDPLDHTKDLIAIRQSQLQSPVSFASTYVHELGHKITGRGDYDREFTDWFVVALTKYVLSNIGAQ